jgi:hypothetical protein
MGANLEAEIGRTAAHDFVDGIRRERLLEAAGAVVLARTEQGSVLVLAVPGGLEVIVDELVGARGGQVIRTQRVEIPRELISRKTLKIICITALSSGAVNAAEIPPSSRPVISFTPIVE